MTNVYIWVYLIPQMYKKSCLNTLYYGLHKLFIIVCRVFDSGKPLAIGFSAFRGPLACGKSTDSCSVCIFLNKWILLDFSFLCSQQYKELRIKFCMLLGYIIDPVHICFYNLEICFINEGAIGAKPKTHFRFCLIYVDNAHILDTYMYFYFYILLEF
jgi:hypothetical protein